MVSRKKLVVSISASSLLAILMLVGITSTTLGTDADNLNVSAYVTAACEVAADPLSFGNYAQGGGNLDVTTAIHITCSSSSNPWIVDANGGQNPSAGARRMKHSTQNEYLTYKLSAASSFTTPFGTGETGGATVSGSGNSNVTVFGRIPGLQTPSAGSYSDVVIVTLTP